MHDERSPAPAAHLAPDLARRLADFARACRTAARAVTLYPGEHPAIDSALTRLVATARHAIAAGPLAITVLADDLAVDGRTIPRPEAAVGELAALLHGHLVGELQLLEPGDPPSWRRFLRLLARSTEELLAEGGIARVWATAGGTHVRIREIDYAEVLRERRSGRLASWQAILDACLNRDTLTLDEAATRALLEIGADADRLRELADRLDDEAAERGSRAQAEAFVRLLHHLAEAARAHGPATFDLVMDNAAAAAARLSPEVMLELLANREEHSTGTLEVVGAVVARMTDSMVTSFVSSSILTHRCATARLAQAFQALVPDESRRAQLLNQVHAALAHSPVGQDAGFEELWTHASEMLLSYRDELFVSDAYARELEEARTRAEDFDRISDDPPERIEAWLATVTDAEIRTYDLQLLLDLLRLEEDPDRWQDVVDPVVAHVEDLVLLGDFESALLLVRALAAEAGGGGRAVRRPIAVAAIERLVAGPLMTSLVGHLRTVDDAGFAQARDLCHALGAVTIRRIAEALVAEERSRAFRRLTDILVSFGSRGRDVVEQLKTSPNPAVRRTAVHLLRAFGGNDALSELVPLLDDAEPHVQREALRAIVNIGTDEAYDLLAQALTSGSPRARNAIVGALGTLRDERAVPLFRYLVQHRAYRRTQRQIFDASIEGLGAVGGAEAVEALRAVLYDGEWWAPFRTAAIRAAAAAALQQIGSPEALNVLQEAARSGPRGVRVAARAHLSGPRPPRSERKSA